jgi:hypothetical protein
MTGSDVGAQQKIEAAKTNQSIAFAKNLTEHAYVHKMNWK